MPEWYDKVSAADQAALELNCTIVNAADAVDCKLKNKCLSDWIEGDHNEIAH